MRVDVCVCVCVFRFTTEDKVVGIVFPAIHLDSYFYCIIFYFILFFLKTSIFYFKGTMYKIKLEAQETPMKPDAMNRTDSIMTATTGRVITRSLCSSG